MAGHATTRCGLADSVAHLEHEPIKRREYNVDEKEKKKSTEHT